MRAGDQVLVLRECLGTNGQHVISYYQRGTYARLVAETQHGWYADFRHPANLPGSFKFNRVRPEEAVWFISHHAIKAS